MGRGGRRRWRKWFERCNFEERRSRDEELRKGDVVLGVESSAMAIIAQTQTVKVRYQNWNYGETESAPSDRVRKREDWGICG